MSSEKEKQLTIQSEKSDGRLGALLDGGVEALLRGAGYRLRGLAFKVGEFDTLLTVRAVSSEGPVVGFVGAGTMSLCLFKLRKQLVGGTMRWRPDEFALRKG